MRRELGLCRLPPLPFTEAVFYPETSHLISGRGLGAQHKSPALTGEGWHFKYVNVKAIKSSANLSPGVIDNVLRRQWCSLRVNWCVGRVSSGSCSRFYAGEVKKTQRSGAERAFLGLGQNRLREGREKGGRESRVRRRRRVMETDENRSPGAEVTLRTRC